MDQLNILTHTLEDEATELRKKIEVIQKPSSEDKEEIGKIRMELERMKRQIEMAHEDCDYILPLDHTKRLIELEEEHGTFKSPNEVTVARAMEIQTVFATVIALSLGRKAAILYKMTRFNIPSQYKALNEDH